MCWRNYRKKKNFSWSVISSMCHRYQLLVSPIWDFVHEKIYSKLGYENMTSEKRPVTRGKRIFQQFRAGSKQCFQVHRYKFSPKGYSENEYKKSSRINNKQTKTGSHWPDSQMVKHNGMKVTPRVHAYVNQNWGTIDAALWVLVRICRNMSFIEKCCLEGGTFSDFDDCMIS